jgi:hypothetical protein
MGRKVARGEAEARRWAGEAYRWIFLCPQARWSQSDGTSTHHEWSLRCHDQRSPTLIILQALTIPASRSALMTFL